MILLIFYYLILPFLLARLVLLFIRKYGKIPISPNIQDLYARYPMPLKHFRVMAKTPGLASWQGDFETQIEAVDRAYEERKKTLAKKEHAEFLVLNDKGEILQQIDA